MEESDFNFDNPDSVETPEEAIPLTREEEHRRGPRRHGIIWHEGIKLEEKPDRRHPLLPPC